MSTVGHARPRRPGAYELRVYVGRDPLTRRKRYATKTVEARTQREADRLLVDFASDALGGRGPGGSLTVGDLLERWHTATAADWSPNNALHARHRIDRYLVGLHDVQVSTLEAVDLDAFYAALKARGGRGGRPLAVSTVRRIHTDLRLALGLAVRWGVIVRNPADDASPGKARRKRVIAPSPAEVGAILDAAAKDPELLTFLFLDAETGARRGELSALRLNDFGADEVTITRALVIGLDTPENARDYAGHYWPARARRSENPKRRTALIEKEPKEPDSERTIALAPETLSLVRGQVERITARVVKAGRAYPPDGFLFPAVGDGLRPLRPDTWTHRYIDLRDALGLTVRLHDLRHFVATSLLTRGMDLTTVAGRLGHGGGGKTTLAIYGHFEKAPDRVASDLMAEVLRRPVEADNVIPLRRPS